MFSTFTKEVDLKLYPLDITLLPKEQTRQLVLGDLHGNAIKLINILIREGVLKLSESQYHMMYEIYHKDPHIVNTEDLANFANILNNADIDSNVTCLFLGDTLADRGMNDYYTLFIYEKLVTNNIKFNIIYSNHDVEFLIQYQAGFDQPNATIFQDQYHAFGTSLTNMQALVADEKIDVSAVNRLVATCYLPHLCLIAAEQTTHEQQPCTLVFTHAPITPNQLLDLIILYNIDVSENDTLQKTIEQINLSFLKSIGGNTANCVQLSGNPTLYPLLNDRYENLVAFDFKRLNIGRRIRWQILENYHALNIHGHVCTEKPSKNLSPWAFINMDTAWGMPGEDIGDYKIGYHSLPCITMEASEKQGHTLWATPNLPHHEDSNASEMKPANHLKIK